MVVAHGLPDRMMRSAFKSREQVLELSALLHDGVVSTNRLRFDAKTGELELPILIERRDLPPRRVRKLIWIRVVEYPFEPAIVRFRTVRHYRWNREVDLTELLVDSIKCSDVASGVELIISMSEGPVLLINLRELAIELIRGSSLVFRKVLRTVQWGRE